jgi:hypothetical protein
MITPIGVLDVTRKAIDCCAVVVSAFQLPDLAFAYQRADGQTDLERINSRVAESSDQLAEAMRRGLERCEDLLRYVDLRRLRSRIWMLSRPSKFWGSHTAEDTATQEKDKAGFALGFYLPAKYFPPRVGFSVSGSACTW